MKSPAVSIASIMDLKSQKSALALRFRLGNTEVMRLKYNIKTQVQSLVFNK